MCSSDLSPLRIPLRALTAGDVSPHVALFLDGFLREPDLEGLRPSTLLDLAAGVLSDPVGATESIAILLADAAERTGAIDDLLQGRDVQTGLQALRAFWTDGDGIVRASAATRAGATHTVLASAHGALIGAPEVAAAIPPGTPLVYVGFTQGDLGFSGGTLLDLSAAGLAPEAFDLTRVSEEAGPWTVLLPAASATARPGGGSPVEEQAARLARVVSALRARTGADVTQIGRAHV